jgi:vancomycin aglycone glucosyltransferase
MRILLSTYGSRGDVEPIAALAVALQARGVEAVVSAPSDAEFVRLLDRAGVPLAPAFLPVREWIAMARTLGETLPQLAVRLAAGQYEALTAAAHQCDAIVATGLFPSKAAAQMIAEQRGLHYVSLHFCPRYVPSPYFTPVAFPGHPQPVGMTDTLALWQHNAEAMNALFGDAVNGQRSAIGLSPVESVRDHVFTHRPWLATDPVLSPWLPGGEPYAAQTGALILPDTRPLPEGLEAFLRAGPPPVYVGFGSMAMSGWQDGGRIAVDAVRGQGRRLILAHGWADLKPVDDGSDCFAVGDVNQQALFPHVAAVVHHGGAGTTVAAARAGTPQFVVPQVADQPYWGERVAALGIGAVHDGPVPSYETLSMGIGVALAAETRARAGVVAGEVRGDGAAVAAEMLIAAVEG